MALDDISFCVGSGVFGLLGHNGAGKTTLMKALVTVLSPSTGTIRVCGFDLPISACAIPTRRFIPPESCFILRFENSSISTCSNTSLTAFLSWILHLENENQLVELQKKSVVLQTTYESHGLTARIMDEDSSFPGAVTDTATLEDAYVYCMNT